MSKDVGALMDLCGTVVKITYRNEHNGYTVLILDENGEEITVVGTMPFVSEGDTLNCTGKMIFHTNYGEQFKAETVERIIKNDRASLLRYLSSGSIKGVGPATARLIVEKFGEDTLEIIEHNPERLAEIKGISYTKAMNINAEYQKQFGLKDIMMLLSAFGVTPDEALKIFKKFGSSADRLINDNPYILCEEGVDFSFDRAEEMAVSFDIDNESAARLKAGIIYILKKNLGNGHTCLPTDKLISVAAELLGVDYDTICNALDNMQKSFVLFEEEIDGKNFIFLPEYYNAEKYIAARLNAVKNQIPTCLPVDELEIDRIENILKIKFGELQRQAILAAVDNGMLILTGGPGTGKTTTLNAIIKILEHRDLSIILAAPTGRAAQRITELTGYEAKTIHRLLETEWAENGKHIFAKNERNPLECDAIIIDEMSMVDTLLFENLLRALRPGCRIIMVGDADQLPSVGAGNVLNDLLCSGTTTSVKLKTVFRQAEKSRIVVNAHAIIDGREIDLKIDDNSDFFMIKRHGITDALNTVLELVTERLPSAYGFSPTEQIQVLCPSRKMDGGSINLNNCLQTLLNPPSKNRREMNYMDVYIREGDKVMQVKNNYDIVWTKPDGEMGSGVFNGDIGIVEAVDKRSGMLKVKFDDKTAEYMSDDLGQLELAYAVTVHKSQGSEFDCVVIPLFDVPSLLRYRNLLYTAVTRAKKMLVIVGREDILKQMAANDRKTLRYTGLIHFLG